MLRDSSNRQDNPNFTGAACDIFLSDRTASTVTSRIYPARQPVVENAIPTSVSTRTGTISAVVFHVMLCALTLCTCSTDAPRRESVVEKSGEARWPKSGDYNGSIGDGGGLASGAQERANSLGKF